MSRDFNLEVLRDKAIKILREMKQLRTDIKNYNRINSNSAWIDVEGVQPISELKEMERFIERCNEHIAELAAVR